MPDCEATEAANTATEVFHFSTQTTTGTIQPTLTVMMTTVVHHPVAVPPIIEGTLPEHRTPAQAHEHADAELRAEQPCFQTRLLFTEAAFAVCTAFFACKTGKIDIYREKVHLIAHEVSHSHVAVMRYYGECSRA